MKQSAARMLLATSFAAILSATLSGCATMTASAVTGSDATRVACMSFKPTYWSAKDTDQTIAQVKEHNARYQALCQPKKMEVTK